MNSLANKLLKRGLLRQASSNSYAEDEVLIKSVEWYRLGYLTEDDLSEIETAIDNREQVTEQVEPVTEQVTEQVEEPIEEVESEV